MSEHQAEFWQREAQQYRLSIAESVGRIHSLVALGLPILITAGAALIASENAEFLVIITPVVIMVWALILNTNQDILLKSAYQYRAERMTASSLPNPEEYVTWEEIGGSVGWEKRASSPSFWGISIVVTLLLVAGSVVLVGISSDLGLLFWLDVAIASAGGTALVIGAISVQRSAAQVFAGFGLERRDSLDKSLDRVKMVSRNP